MSYKKSEDLKVGDKIATPEGPRKITKIERDGRLLRFEVDTIDPYVFVGHPTAPVNTYED